MWQSKCNLPDKESNISFEDETHWCTIPFCEREGGELEGVIGKGRHNKECCILIDQIGKHKDFFLVWGKDGIFIPSRMNLSFECLVYAKNKKSGRMIGMLYYLYVNRLENSLFDSYNLNGFRVDKQWISIRQTERNSCLVKGKWLLDGKSMEQSNLKRK